MRERVRITAAELQRERMLGGIEVEMVRERMRVAMDQRTRGDHLRVQPRVARDETQEVPAVPVRPVHHGSDAEAPGARHWSSMLCSGSERDGEIDAPFATVSQSMSAAHSNRVGSKLMVCVAR